MTKVGAVKSAKPNPDGTIRNKTRIIVDSKQSGITSATKRSHKTQLPIATATIKGMTGMMKPDVDLSEEDIEMLIRCE